MRHFFGLIIVAVLAATLAAAASADSAYPAQLQAALKEKLPSIPINLSVELQPGKTAEETDAALIKLVEAKRPTLVIWQTGTVDAMRSVDPDVTGTPVIAYESIRRMEKAYRQGTLYAFVLVGVLSAVMIRRIRETALALAPLVLGTLWAVGFMRLVGLKFNLANVWGVPLIIGASAEYGLNVVTRFVEARTYGGPPFARSTVMAVALNGLTTISGFGSLLVAHHEGMRSLGLLLTIGSGTSLIASLAVLPVLIRLFYQSPRATADDRILSA